MVSEEHDPAPVDMTSIVMPPTRDEEVDAIVLDDMRIPASEVRIIL